MIVVDKGEVTTIGPAPVLLAEILMAADVLYHDCPPQFQPLILKCLSDFIVDPGRNRREIAEQKDEWKVQK